MIGVDVSPLCGPPRRGVARALLTLLRAWDEDPPPCPVHPIAPSAPPPDVPRLAGAIYPDRPLSTHREFRARLPALIQDQGLRVFLSPYSAVARLPIPAVAWVHEVPFVRHGALEGWTRSLRHRTWLGRNVRSSAAILVPSQATAADVIRLYPRAEPRVRAIPNAFDPRPWRRQDSVLPPRRPQVVVVGTGWEGAGPKKKGIDVLLRAWRSRPLPGWDLCLVGRWPRSVPTSVLLFPDLGDVALARLLHGASMLVHPARSEGFGYPPLEAMAAGLPVVATRVGAIPEVVGEAALLVEPGRWMDLARALRRLSQNEDRCAGLVAAGAQRAGAYPPRRVSASVLELLCEVGGM